MKKTVRNEMKSTLVFSFIGYRARVGRPDGVRRTPTYTRNLIERYLMFSVQKKEDGLASLPPPQPMLLGSFAANAQRYVRLVRLPLKWKKCSEEEIVGVGQPRGRVLILSQLLFSIQEIKKQVVK